MKKFTYLFFVLFAFNVTNAQVSLPYFSGFDNTAQQSGWTEYKKGSLEFSHWGYATMNAYSPTKCISHDYSPSTGITVTDNWFVSPGFIISANGKLDSLRYMFSGFSVPGANDTIAVYLLQGSQNPSLATSKILLFDFRGDQYIADFTYRILTNISLPSSSQAQYLAIRYLNSDCSSQWLSVFFDNVAISGTSNAGIHDVEADLQIFPNPTAGKITIKNTSPFDSYVVYNIVGQEVLGKKQIDNNENVIVDLTNQQKGIYFIKFFSNSKTYTKKIILQ